MIVAGVGCRRGTQASDIEAAIRTALAQAGVRSESLSVIATIAAKQNEAGIETAAAKLGVHLVVVSEADLQAARPHTQTTSERVLALMGVPSVAEAAALAAAGPSARLIAPRLVVGSATCALAASGSTP